MKVKLEFTLPDKYAGSCKEMFAAMVAASISESTHLKKDVIKCIVKNCVKVVEDKDERLDSLGYYVCNDQEELPAILETLLAYNGDSTDLDEICPELVLWEKVQDWDYSQLMGAIS
jgi:hypothetical protein